MFVGFSCFCHPTAVVTRVGYLTQLLLFGGIYKHLITDTMGLGGLPSGTWHGEVFLGF